MIYIPKHVVCSQYSVTPLVLQDTSGIIQDHSTIHMDTQSEIMKYHLDFLIQSSLGICSHIGNISITLPSYQSINDSYQDERKDDVFYLQIGIGCRIAIVNGHSSSTGKLVPGRWTNDYSLMLQWFILHEMGFLQFRNSITSRDVKSHCGEQSRNTNRYVTAHSTEWTYTKKPLFRPHLLGPGKKRLGIHTSLDARDTFPSIYG